MNHIRLIINMETYFLPTFCEGTSYQTFRQQLNYADINMNHKNHGANTPISIKAEVPIFPEREDEMVAIH